MLKYTKPVRSALILWCIPTTFQQSPVHRHVLIDAYKRSVGRLCSRLRCPSREYLHRKRAECCCVSFTAEKWEKRLYYNSLWQNVYLVYCIRYKLTEVSPVNKLVLFRRLLFHYPLLTGWLCAYTEHYMLILRSCEFRVVKCHVLDIHWPELSVKKMLKAYTDNEEKMLQCSHLNKQYYVYLNVNIVTKP
jgi:hypothetical protein